MKNHAILKGSYNSDHSLSWIFSLVSAWALAQKLELSWSINIAKRKRLGPQGLSCSQWCASEGLSSSHTSTRASCHRFLLKGWTLTQKHLEIRLDVTFPLEMLGSLRPRCNYWTVQFPLFWCIPSKQHDQPHLMKYCFKTPTCIISLFTAGCLTRSSHSPTPQSSGKDHRDA